MKHSNLRCAPSLLLVALAAAACGRASPRAGSDNTHAANAKPAWEGGRGWRIAPAPSAVIGEDEGEPETQLGHVRGALAVSDTTIVVGDQGTAQIRYFSRNGTPLRTVGRKGDGPGEFRRIDWIGARADTVVVWDSFAARVTLLKPDGTVARTVPVFAAAGDVYPAVGLLDDGLLLLRVRTTPQRAASGAWVDSATCLLVSTRDGAVVSRPGPFLRGEVFTTFEGRNSMTSYLIFGKRGIVAAGPAGLLTGTTDRLELTLRGRGGKAVRTIGRPFRPQPADEAAIAAERRQRAASSDLATIDRQMAQVEQRQIARLPHRDTLPAFTRALVDGGGNVWMEEFRIDPDAAGTWSVFDPDGRWLGQVQTPAGVKVMSISRNAMVGVTRDENDVERVVVYPLLR